MKQKNMTLMVVAIGCGLVAAFLTARLSGGSGPEMIDVIVAKKELPVGTILEDKEIESMVAIAKFPKANVPPDTIANMEELKGKRVNRTLKPGNMFAAGDVGLDNGIKLPEGMFKYAIKLDSVRAVAGFVQPGDKVDVMLTEQTQGGKAKSGMIRVDMLVLAVDQGARPIEGGPQGRAQVTSVSLAVTHEDAKILSSAEKRGEVKLILREPKNLDKTLGSATETIDGFDNANVSKPVDPPIKTVAVIVAKSEVPMNTFITDDNFSDFFTKKEVPESFAPGKSIRDQATVRSKYITSKLVAEQTLFGDFLSDNKVEIPVVKVEVPVQPDTKVAPEQLPTPREVVQEKPLYPRKFEQIINNQRVWFLEVGPGEFRRVDGNPADLKELPSTGTIEKKDEKKPSEARGDRAA